MNFYKGITLRYQKQLEEKNEENELLLGEVHHRVKNNLQLITSMLRLRERQLTSDKAKKLIGESREQIKAIATAHESLYKKNMGDLLDMNEYVKQLVADTREALGDTAITWKSHIDIGRLFLNADTAVPIGLILNELITNSLKYAKPIRQEVLRIEVKVSEIDGLVQLTYSDNGTPAPEMADALEAGSKRGFGMKLIRSLCRQLGADVNVSTENGLVYDFIFNTQQTVEA
ncbi:sensor histidine kinase [Fulvitalea axinellae]